MCSSSLSSSQEAISARNIEKPLGQVAGVPVIDVAVWSSRLQVNEQVILTRHRLGKLDSNGSFVHFNPQCMSSYH